MESTSRSKRWFDKLPPEKQEAVRERNRLSHRKRRANLSEEDRAKERKKNREWHRRARGPSVKSAFQLYVKLLELAKNDAGLAAVLKRYNKVAVGRWRRALQAFLAHKETVKGTRGKEYLSLRNKVYKEWQRVTKMKGFAVLSSHMLKLAAIVKKKKEEGEEVTDAAAAGKASGNLNKETGEGDDDEMMRPQPATKKKTRKSRRGQLDVDAGPWLKLRNDNKRDCYMIAAVNLLHTVDALRNGITEAAPILEAAGNLTPTMTELVATLNGQRNDVVGLRLAAGLPEEIGDSCAFLTRMLEDFSEVNERTCKTTLAVDRTCTNGHINRNVHPSGVTYLHILNAAALPDGFVEGSIDDIYTTNQVSAATCGECSASIVSADVRIHPAGSLIMFHINRSTHAGGVRGERPLRISGVNMKRMVILGQRVRIVACVQHIAWNKGDAGHYVVWRRGKENGWSVVDDHEQCGQRQLPDKLCNIHLIVFEVY